jgi:hypothetical protein
MFAKHMLHAGFLLGRFQTLKTEVIRSYETSVHFWCYIPENDNIQS